jgi:hypothetical protein
MINDKIMNRLPFILMLFFGILLFFGCQKPWNEPEFNAKEWTPPSGTQPSQFWTIDNPNQDNKRNVLWKHRDNVGAWKSQPDSITDYRDRLRYMRAVVVSSDEGGNYYKSMVVQDSTGGVELELDMSGLYNTYPVGQKVVIVLNGLVIGDNNYLPQIGWIYNENQVGRINPLFIDKYIIKDGLPSLKNLPKPLKNNDIDFNSQRDINKLVRLEKVTFEPLAIGKPIAFDDVDFTEWNMYIPLANGIKQEVIVRTSSYAKFRNTIIENKEYNITGILTIFRNNYQFMIRTKEDIEVIAPEPGEYIVFDFTTNPIGEGKWSIHPTSVSSAWAYRNNSVAHIGNKTGSSHTDMDDWLISPVITCTDMANSYLRFEHQLNVQNANYSAYKVYYTSSNSTTFNLNDWNELGENTSFPNTFDWSNPLSISKISSKNFRIAFRYYSTDPNVETYQWSIRKVEIRNK